MAQQNQRITLLPQEVIRRIAAGEVIERPASIVKELMENSLDAGSTRVQVDIETSGGAIAAITVTDDGCGIRQDDLGLAVTSHATSKIRSDEDLFAIHTLGFRGEALASIGEVASLTITTRHACERFGSEITVREGKKTGPRPAASPCGTRTVVREIFASVPARKKFLKSLATEIGRIMGVVEQAALSSPERGFVLTVNRKEKVCIPPGGTLETTLAALFGIPPGNKFFKISCNVAGITIDGLLSKPDLVRQDPFRLFLVLNGRPVRSPMIVKAAKDAYGSLIPHGAWPTGCIRLELDPGRIDVNVHPAKLIVRFEDEKSVCEAVHSAVSSALSREDLAERLFLDPITPASPTGLVPGYRQDDERPDRWEIRETDVTLLRDTEKRLRQTAFDEDLGHRKETPRVLAQVHDLYLVASDSTRALWLVDQHAAHERVLYEQVLKADPGDVQELIVPVPLYLTPSETAIMQEVLEDLLHAGFSIEPFGHDTYVVRTVPAAFGRIADPSEVQGTITSILSEGHDSAVPFRVRVAEVVACRGAIKAGSPCSPEQGDQLVRQLLRCTLPYTCPHGRPTMVRFAPHDIARLFKRT